MITCRQLTELITDYLEGRLPFLGWVRFQLHLGTCRLCRAYLTQMRQTRQALAGVGRLAIEPPPAAVRDELLARFRHWKRV